MDAGITGMGVVGEDPEDGVVEAPFTKPFAIWFDVDVDASDGGVVLQGIQRGNA